MHMRRLYNQRILKGGDTLEQCKQENETLQDIIMEDYKLMDSFVEKNETLQRRVDELEKQLKTFSSVFTDMTFRNQ